MRAFGFSTGAVAFGDFAKGLELAHAAATNEEPIVELSALRAPELEPLLRALPSLDLGRFKYVSIHAPSHFDPADERDIAQSLLTRTCEFNIVVHPDAISNFDFWRPLGSRLCIENMDKRKPIGRNCSELDALFSELPEASFCLDVGHSRQVDPTMADTREMLRHFGDRLRQLHLSDVTSSSQHERLSLTAILAFRSVASCLPERTPIIIESVFDDPLTLAAMNDEVERAQRALPCSEAASKELAPFQLR